MSRVTNIILITGCPDGKGPDCSAHKLIHWLEVEYGGSEWRDNARLSGGDKNPECCIFIGAINYLIASALLNQFVWTTWKDPDSAQLWLMGEDDEVFTCHRVLGQGFPRPHPEHDPDAVLHHLKCAITGIEAIMSGIHGPDPHKNTHIQTRRRIADAIMALRTGKTYGRVAQTIEDDS